jgi:TRAP-type C4-dicarboxylate transport system permease small subunit
MAVVGGLLLAVPPWSIVGAVVLVGASILLSVGSVWLARRSWDEAWPPDVTPSLRQRLRRARVMQVVGSALTVGMVGIAIFALVRQDWGQLAYAVALLVLGAGNLELHQRALRRLRDAQAQEEAS